MSNNQEDISSIIVLGETGSGKSTFCNNLCLQPKCAVGDDLNSQTERISGINCDGDYHDIFIIDTPGMNDSNGPEQDERNINLMNDYIRQNSRIKGIIILLKFTDNRLTGSLKKSLKTFYDMFPMNNFWSHVIIIFSHYYANNEEEKQKRKTNLIKKYNQEFINIMNQSKIDHPNFIIPRKVKFYFCELKNPNEETKNEILNAINYLKNKEQMFKKIEERLEEPKIANSTKLGNTTTINYIKEKVTTFTDFDDTQTESRKIIDSWEESYIEEKEKETKEKVDGEKKIFEHYTYKKTIHKNRYGEEDINIDKENPLDFYIETEEMTFLPEEIEDKVDGNKTTSTHKFYKQLKFVDKNKKETFGKKILLDSFKTFKEVVEDTPIIQTEGNTQITNYRRKNKHTDKNGKVTYDDPIIYKSDRQTTVTKIETRTVYVDSDSDCSIF